MPSIPPAIPPTQLGFIPDWGGIGRCCKFYYDEYFILGSGYVTRVVFTVLILQYFGPKLYLQHPLCNALATSL